MAHTTAVTDTSQATVSRIVTITAIAAIENAQNIPNSKKVVLDAQVYVGSENCESLIGALLYFNRSNINFGDVTIYLIYATIAKFEEGADILPTASSPSKYNFIGDITWIIPLTSSASDSDADSSSFSIDPCQHAYLHVSGVATNCQKEQRTFDFDIDHYSSALKPVQKVKPSAPISCMFPNLPHYKAGKPVPYDKHYVSVSGFLTNIIYDPNSADVVQRFHLLVDNIVFMGQQPNAMGATVPNSLDASRRTPRSGGKVLITYKHKSPMTPTTPTLLHGPVAKQRRVKSPEGSLDSLASGSQEGALLQPVFQPVP